MILKRIDPKCQKIEKLSLKLVELYLILEKEKECLDIVHYLENIQNFETQI
jgi:hypothetical protein